LQSGVGFELENFYKFNVELDDTNNYIPQESMPLRTKFFFLRPSYSQFLGDKKLFYVNFGTKLQIERIFIANKLNLPNNDIADDIVMQNYLIVPELSAGIKILNDFKLGIGLGYAVYLSKTLNSSLGEYKVRNEELPHFYYNDVIFLVEIAYLLKNFEFGVRYEDYGDSKFYMTVPPLHLRGGEVHNQHRMNFVISYNF
jgi:hypothetical protein